MSERQTEPPPLLPPTGSLQGATIQSTYLTRDIPVYGIQEHEVESLSTLNTQAASYFSAASALVAFGLSIAVNAAFYDTLTPMAIVALKVIMPICLLVALAFFLMGRYARKRGNDVWSRIKAQSRRT